MTKWTVTVTCNYVTLENKYTAYSELDPIDIIIEDYFEELADELYNCFSSYIYEDFETFMEDVNIITAPAQEGEDYTIIYDDRDIEIKKWVITCYDGVGCELYYTAYSREDPVEYDLIPPRKYDEMADELFNEFSYTIDDNNEDEIEEFYASIMYKARIADNDEQDYDIVYDERTESN